MWNLLKHEFVSRRGVIIGWTIGLVLYAAFIILVFPQFIEPMQAINFADIPLYQAFGDFSDLASFEGFFVTQLLGYLPILLGIYGIMAGVGALAGEEDNGTLELILTLPLKRWHLVLAKGIAIALVMLIILILLGLSNGVFLEMIRSQVETETTFAEVVIVTIAAWPLCVFFALFGLLLGAYLPNRKTGNIVGIVTVVYTYFGNNLGNIMEILESSQPFMPFYYYQARDILDNGIGWGDAGILLGAAALCLILAILSFQRRNVTVGAWPWARWVGKIS